MLTVSGLKSVIDSHNQLTTLISMTFVNPATSTTNLVLEAVGKLMNIVRSDVDSSQLFLDKYQISYKKNMAFIVQTISVQLSLATQQIGTWSINVNPRIFLEQYDILKNITTLIKSTLSSANDAINNLATMITFCPRNLLENPCSSFIHDIYNKLDKIESTIDLILTECASGTPTDNDMSSVVSDSIVSEVATTPVASSDSDMPRSITTPLPSASSATPAASEMTSAVSDSIVSGTSATPSAASGSDMPAALETTLPRIFFGRPMDPGVRDEPCGGSERHDYVITHRLDLQLSISEVISCVTTYEEFLSAFQSFLDSVDRTVPSVDMSVATRTMNTLSTDGIWLETLMIKYQNGSQTKRSLSDVFLRQSNNRLLLNVDSAVSSVELSVLSLISSTISTIETRTISIYSQMIAYLYQMQKLMPDWDSDADDLFRDLRIWKSLSPTLLHVTVSKLHFNHSIHIAHQ